MNVRILLICALMLLGNACQEPASELDRIILECYASRYEAEGYDIKTIIDDYEKVLIEKGVLQDGSSESYLAVLQKVYTDKGYRIQAPAFMENDPYIKIVQSSGLAVMECEKEMLASLQESDPKWRRMLNPDSPELKQNPERVVEFMAEDLSEKDLNSYYFRLKMFQVFDGANAKWRNSNEMPDGSAD
ncbi:hypothetical protein [Robiginitalea sp. IMCC43444]|uniref:hypothetical protein n=1 Tax=Robiginitalea sp. IMCC43444 TaxID=3459121 RepID=UPI0040422A50